PQAGRVRLRSRHVRPSARARHSPGRRTLGSGAPTVKGEKAVCPRSIVVSPFGGRPRADALAGIMLEWVRRVAGPIPVRAAMAGAPARRPLRAADAEPPLHGRRLQDRKSD